MGGHRSDSHYRRFMAGHVQVVRCKRCKRRYYASEEKCPECGITTSRGRLKRVLIVLFVALTITGAVMLTIAMMKQTTKLEQLPGPSGGS